MKLKRDGEKVSAWERKGERERGRKREREREREGGESGRTEEGER